MLEKMIVGNWKMYKTVEETHAFVKGLVDAKLEKKSYLAVPFTAIQGASNLAKDTNVIIGAQNMNDAEEGAYTGEIAALMLKDVGAQFVLLGHSERRKYFKESDEFINRKVKRALEDGLLPILCVGESYEEKEAGETEKVLKRQIEKGLEGVAQDKKVVVAYEPIWAIGTGNTATPDIANKVQGYIRNILGARGPQTQILYGGSVTPDNVATLVKEENIDGVLVGGASLSLESFIKILQNGTLN